MKCRVLLFIFIALAVSKNVQAIKTLEEASSHDLRLFRTDPSRFKTIKVSPEIALDEINFWGRQMSEHALFLHLGLEDPQLKREGLVLHKQFESFRKSFNKETMDRVLPLTRKLREYQVRVLQTLNTGKWIGWIFPLFAQHITLELDYFVDKLNDVPYSDQDEIEFWNVINGDHAGFAAHLLDPSERELFIQADTLNQRFAAIVPSEKEMFRQISLKAARELDEYAIIAQAAMEQNKVRSVIHPVLLAHVIREGKRSIDILNSLTDTRGAVYPHEDITKD